MIAWLVEYVFQDEAAPRELHTATVYAADARDARLVLQGQMPADRVSVVDVRQVRS